MAITTPVPAYRDVAGRSQNTPRSPGARRVCVECFDSRPANLTSTSRTESNQVADPFANPTDDGIPVAQCAGSACIDIRTEGPRPPSITEPPREEKRLVETRIEPAMLIHRVEPVYPTLAKPIGLTGPV